MIIKDERQAFILQKAHAIAFRAMFYFGVAILAYQEFSREQANNDLLVLLAGGAGSFIASYFYFKSKY